MNADEHGRKLHAVIIAKSLTRQSVADVLNVSPRTVNNWITGRTLPNLETYFKLRDLLGDYDGSIW